jgi:hypothetical protein
LLVSDLVRGAVVRLVDDSVCVRESPLAGVGGRDGTGFSNRSFDVVLTGGAGGTDVASKRLGLACVIFKAPKQDRPSTISLSCIVTCR